MGPVNPSPLNVQQEQKQEHPSLDLPPAFLGHGLPGTVPLMPTVPTLKAVLLLSCNSGSFSLQLKLSSKHNKLSK